MRGVTLIEAGFRSSFIPVWLRPVIAGRRSGAGLASARRPCPPAIRRLHADINISYPFLVVLGCC